MILQSRRFFAFIVLISLSFCGNSQSITQQFRQYADSTYKNIYTFFYDPSSQLFRETTDYSKDDHPYSYLWPLCALIQAGNEMEIMNTHKSYMEGITTAIKKYYTTKSPAPGYKAYLGENDDRYIDDNQWVGLAYMDAYKRTSNKNYLTLAEEIYRFMMTGFDLKLGGGLYWRENDTTTKNTCSNGPGIVLALKLYNATGNKKFFDTAMLLYNWTNKHLQAADGLFYDAIKIPGGKIDSAKYTYNTGTMLQANAMLYNITKDKKYLTEAQRIASASATQFYKNGHFPGNDWFNAVLLRGYEELFLIDKNKAYVVLMMKDADRKWQQRDSNTGLMGKEVRKKLLDQAGILEIFARLANIEAML
ncbi:glycoside hydrolase family 76 protein [Danxiaibacter flavus]|uniref:Glycoside hydrolase family 76 protein n=1 Tax=Danxiaibacter flavus TaxID=3049108 RepID=A0ABV3ZEE8_9BACT|nr:glycoside hydrolase family 76 protein [Chitinophagaceae bacterium DXS]